MLYLTKALTVKHLQERFVDVTLVTSELVKTALFSSSMLLPESHFIYYFNVKPQVTIC